MANIIARAALPQSAPCIMRLTRSAPMAIFPLTSILTRSHRPYPNEGLRTSHPRPTHYETVSGRAA